MPKNPLSISTSPTIAGLDAREIGQVIVDAALHIGHRLIIN